MPPAKTVYLVDGSGQFHRAFHAIRGLATSKGLPTNATYGFTTMLRKLLEDEKPEYVAVLFDPPGKTFRHDQYAEYKANRPRMDDDLAVQLPYIRRVCEALRMPVVEVPGFEADDVIATLARQAVERGHRVVVVSADKDLLQLVNGDVLVLNPGREGSGSTRFDRKAVEEKWGVPPERIVDVLALVGDSVDNVPGVPGIGDKGARDLVREYGPVESVLEHADEVKRGAYREGLKGHREKALLSKQLVTLRTDVPVELDLEALRSKEPDRPAAHALFKQLEFQALARAYAPEVEAAAAEHRLLTSREEIEAIAGEARKAGRLALGVVVTGPEAMRAEALGVALSWTRGRSAYVPLGHSSIDLPQAPAREDALGALRPLLEDGNVRKASAHAKRDRIVLERLGVNLAGPDFDALVAAYLLDPGRRAYALEDLAMEHVGERRAPGTGGVAAADAAAIPTGEAAGGEAELVLRLDGPVTERLEAEGLEDVYEGMEMPLVAVLADMELAGVKVDAELLRAMSRDMEAQLKELALVHELPRKILEYRSVQKLKSTYVDALPELVNPRTGRIHATFNQTVAATGRLSSADPNLQNIPIRTPEGRRIREAFVAERGTFLMDTFRRGEDVHDRTSREIFGPLSPIPPAEQRRISKMVNYALLYGKTAFSLAKDIAPAPGPALEELPGSTSTASSRRGSCAPTSSSRSTTSCCWRCRKPRPRRPARS